MRTQKSKIKLSIAIPTYNGEKYIIDAIDSIFTQSNDFTVNDVEVVVLNNASTDSTVEKIINCKYADKIQIHTHPINIGFDKNVLSAFEICHGDYILFLGDDDYLVNHCIADLLTAIGTGEFTALLLPVAFHNTLTNQISFKSKLKQDTSLKNINNFFNSTELDSSCISSVCFKRKALDTGKVENCINSNWIHIAILIETINSENTVYCFHKRMVNVRIHNNRWETNFGNQLISGLIHLNIIKSYYEKKIISQQVYSKIFNIKYNHNLNSIIGLKPKSFKDQIQSARLMIQLFYRKPVLWIIHLPVLMMPNVFFKILIQLYRFCRTTFKAMAQKKSSI